MDGSQTTQVGEGSSGADTLRVVTDRDQQPGCSGETDAVDLEQTRAVCRINEGNTRLMALTSSRRYGMRRPRVRMATSVAYRTGSGSLRRDSGAAAPSGAPRAPAPRRRLRRIRPVIYWPRRRRFVAIGTAFISHKKKDDNIADVVGSFIDDVSNGRVGVFLSSKARFEGPSSGDDLRAAVDQGIEDAGVLILVYTGKTAGVDWDWCVYECATARNKGIPVIILQFVDETPAPFLGTVTRQADDREDVYRFTKEFLTSENFLKGQTEKVTDYSPDHPNVKKKADAFHAMLTEAIKEYLGKELQRWSAWPVVRLEMSAVGQEGKTSADQRIATVRDQLLQEAVVADSSGVDQIFGLGVDDGEPFSSLVDSWRESHSDDDQPAWLDSLAQQIEAFSRKRYPELRGVRLPEVQGSSSYVPIVTGMLSYPESDKRQYDIEFYDIKPLSPPITQIMIDREEMYCLRLEPDEPQPSLSQLYRDMKDKDVHRVPVLDSDWRVLYPVHRSVISEFLLDTDAADPTLDDLLAVPGKEDALAGSVAFVDPSATVESARDALAAVEGARDLFVTPGGDPDKPILGMVTNTDLEQRT
jgi:hypothetical protein